MTRREHIVLWAATLVTAVTRAWSLARSPWDWDEILFSLALRHYDVALHHPHPPGFPLFIAAAKILQAAGLSDFRSLQMLNLIAGLFLVPAMFFFCRELGLRFRTSLIAALFLAFFPNVWFFGETAFSDVPSIVLVAFACGLLLRGRRSDVAYIGGAIALAVAGGFRPQNLLIGLAPALMATWDRGKERRWPAIAAAIIAGGAIVAGSYAAAAFATGGWERYSEAVRAHQQYITQTDSFRSPTRPPLHHLLDDFFVRPYHAPLINFTITAVALLSFAASLVRRRVPLLIAVAAFAPFCLAAWLFLDHFSASRFSIGYAPLIAILAADGVAIIADLAKRDAIEWAVGLAVTILMFVWTVPAIDLPRRSDSPPVQAIEWVRTHVPPSNSVIYVHESLGPFVEYFLPDYHVEWTLEGPSAARLDPAPSWYMREGTIDRKGAINFAWPHDRAWNVARRRYFEAGVLPLSGEARFDDGWYGPEVTKKSAWRWMAGHGGIELPAIEGKARLRLRFFVPLHVMHTAPTIVIRMNGLTIATIAAHQPFIDFVRDFDPAAGAPTLDLSTNVVVNPLREHLGGDERDLGVRLDELEWTAIEK
ncbi:MAG TPA: hypothetical protein VLV78_00645 [Thermoanaerobaculia bacterium]|nr:hypothetical protein [Thermoanaerobaculia bacterium]